MSRQDFARDWVPFRDPILGRYPELDDAALAEADGSTDALSETIAARQGISPAEARRDLHEFLGGPMPADAFAAPANDDAAMRASGDYVPAGEVPSDDDERFGDDDKIENPVGRDR